MKSKKQMKKMTAFSCIMMALIMVLSMLPITSAFAATSPEHEYEIFQIFTGSVSEDSEKNVGDLKWGYSGSNNGTAVTVGDKVPQAVIDELTPLRGNSTKTDAEKVAVIKKFADLTKNLPDTKYTLEKKNNAWVFEGLEPGYYLVRDKDGSQSVTSGAYTLYFVEVTTGTITVSPKSSIPTVTKVIVDNGEHTANAASIGEDVNYKITATVPANINDYKEYYLQFVDTLSKGLTFKASTVKVYIGSVSDENDVTDYFHVKATKDSASGKTSINVTIGNLMALKNIADKKYSFVGAETPIILTYAATLNTDAVINGANPNTVKLVYSNDPNESGEGTTEPPTTYTNDPDNPEDEPEKPGHTGDTVEHTVRTYTTQFTVKKVDGDLNALSGAEFTLTGDDVKTVISCTNVYTADAEGTYYKLKDGTYTTTAPTDETSSNYAGTETYKLSVTTEVKSIAEGSKSVTAAVGADGYVTFQGLGVGAYTLSETKTPAGYNTAEDVNFEIEFNPGEETMDCTNSTVTVEEDGSMWLTVVNRKGSTLPTTGGIGTTIFYVLGSILVLGAVVVLITRKRMSAEEN
jgi:fimbrial isopeptide formation D2 family protein/LPXTG-motif cell wall-anchored protein